MLLTSISPVVFNTTSITCDNLDIEFSKPSDVVLLAVLHVMINFEMLDVRGS